MNDLSGTLVTPTRYTTELPICVGASASCS